MQIIISPAKKMNEDRDSFASRGFPQFLNKTEYLLSVLQGMDYAALKKLWGCSDKLAELNMARLQKMDLKAAQTPAILSYEGIQYQYMAPAVFTGQALEYTQEHLCILSGFYGIVRPFDAVTPYRLEMQSKLKTCKGTSLYEYWGSMLCESIYAETDCVLNLASHEYSLCVSKYKPQDKQLITCLFTERKGQKLIEKGTLCKMARGDMVRFLAENRISDPEGVKKYHGLGFRYSETESDQNTYIFIKEDPSC